MFEELDAEISSAFLNAELVFVDATMENHASYIDSRLAELKRDKMVIVSAATLAAKAHRFIMGLIASALSRRPQIELIRRGKVNKISSIITT